MLVGIDLGTTNSLIGWWTDDGARLVANGAGELLTPSVVGLTDDGELLVGRAAQARQVSHASQTVAAFKRFMGTTRDIVLGQRTFRPEELASLVLRSLVDDVQAVTGERPGEAVISVPAYFSDAQRKATRTAGVLAGLRVERLINEPTAAALAYGLENREEQTKFLVFDLGGGTFDVSILEKFEGIMEVHASAGDNFLGGEDFVSLLAQTALAELGVDATTLSVAEHASLRQRMERLKIQLTGAPEASTSLTLAGRERAWSIAESRFESLAAPLLQRMRAPLERALRDSRTDPAQLSEIVLVGGATRMPMIARLIARMFGRLPLRHVNPDETVARGAVVMAGMKARHEALAETVMTDVCPYTLGVEVVDVDANGHFRDGLFSPIIERNTVIPASRVETYVPTHERQRFLDLKIYQGESPRVANNILLDTLRVSLPGKDRFESRVDVRFTYDGSGILQVEATVVTTGARAELVIAQHAGVLSRDEIASRLAALAAIKVHPRDRQANLAAIARAERLYEETIGDTRQHVGDALRQFTHELETQDPARADRARAQLLAFIARVEANGLFH